MTPGPNLFVVGAPKAGTTSLWAYLGRHPDIFMSRIKDPHFFSRASGREEVKEPAAYARLFAGGAGHRYRGEASQSYLWDAECAGRIKAAIPEARIVVSLRDPVERAWSSYVMTMRVGHEERPFAQALDEELEADEVDLAARPPPYIARGFYAEQLARYLEAFGSDATIVLLFEELVADVRGTMRTVFARLGLDTRPAETMDTSRTLPFQAPRGPVANVALSVPGARRAGGTLLRGRALALARRAVFKKHQKPVLDPGLRRMLREVFAPHDARLRELLGRPLPWDGCE